MRKSFVLSRVGAVAAFLALSPGAVAQSNDMDQKAMIATICGTQIALDSRGCTCFAEHAMTELDEPQRAYLILTVVQPPAAERHEIARSQADLTTLAQFIDRTRQSCASASEAPAGANPPPAASGEGAN